MQACGKLSCTKLFGGVEAEKVLVVFEILNNSNIWLFHIIGKDIFDGLRYPFKGM